MSGIYFGDWEKSGWIGLVADFEGIYIDADAYAKGESPWKNGDYWNENKSRLDAVLGGGKYPLDIIFAGYVAENYEGDAFVLFRKDGKLYEVNGSHCSCYELEGQWEPEETFPEAVLKRVKASSYGVMERFSADIEKALA